MKPVHVWSADLLPMLLAIENWNYRKARRKQDAPDILLVETKKQMEDLKEIKIILACSRDIKRYRGGLGSFRKEAINFNLDNKYMNISKSNRVNRAASLKNRVIFMNLWDLTRTRCRWLFSFPR